MKRADARAANLQQQREQKYEQQLKQQQMRGDDVLPASEKRMSRTSSSIEASSVFEEELRAAFHSIKLSDGVARPKFPILNTMGRVTLNTIFGMATQVTKATGVLIEATKETLEGGDVVPSGGGGVNSVRRSSLDRATSFASSSSGSAGYAAAQDAEMD